MKTFKVTAFFNENHVDMAVVVSLSKSHALESYKSQLDEAKVIYHWIDIFEIDDTEEDKNESNRKNL